MPVRRPEVEAEIVFLDGDRALPLTLSHPTARYRPHVSTKDPSQVGGIRSEDRMGVEFPLQARDVQLCVAASYVFHPLFPGVDYSSLQVGILFVILEGDTVVGRGRVISVSDGIEAAG